MKTAKLHAYVHGERRPDLDKLSPAMWAMLYDVRDIGNTWRGAEVTRRALVRRDLLLFQTLTDAGRAACSVEWREAPAKARA